jgi:DnaJ-class molecular chaperone
MWYKKAILLTDIEIEMELLHNATTQEEIHRNYRNLSKRHHPDVNQDPDSTRNFQNIQNIYEEVKDEPLYSIEDFTSREITEDDVRDNIELQDNFLNTDEEALKMGILQSVETYFNNNVPDNYDTPGFDVYENIAEEIYDKIKDIQPMPYQTIANLINNISANYIRENYS